jgi:hypothetical protein
MKMNGINGELESRVEDVESVSSEELVEILQYTRQGCMLVQYIDEQCKIDRTRPLVYFQRFSLQLKSALNDAPIQNPPGATMAPLGNFLYTSNIQDGGQNDGKIVYLRAYFSLQLRKLCHISHTHEHS